MSPRTVLVAALSGRALAASARRAGFIPLVVDAFGDQDTRASAAAYHGLPEATRTGFRAPPSVCRPRDASCRVRACALRPRARLGLRGHPQACRRTRTPLPDAGQRLAGDCRAPRTPLNSFLCSRSLPSRIQRRRPPPPADPEGWLSKRVGGSGGAHVVPCAAARSAARPLRPAPFERRRLYASSPSANATSSPSWASADNGRSAPSRGPFATAARPAPPPSIHLSRSR